MALKRDPKKANSSHRKPADDHGPVAARPPGNPLAPEGAREAQDDSPRPGVTVVGIGASAGGLDAFKRFFTTMPPDAGMAFILVPHLDPKHESLMVELMARQTAMPVVEAAEGELIEINHVYIIPPNRFLTMGEGRLRLAILPEPTGGQTALDSFFRSLAEEQKERAIGIVLSGTGSHGTPGIKEIKLAGGMVMVQEPESAAFDQMPRNAIDTGLVDFVVPPEQMPPLLIKYVRQLHVSKSADDLSAQDVLNRILALLKARTRFDFRCYRKSMLLRRIERRMGLGQIERMGAYLDALHESAAEVSALHKDLLIGVTGFFRDPEAFQVLEQRVIPELLSRDGPSATLRVWVPACSSGEEAYTIAMLVLEQVAQSKTAREIQIFATDIDDEALTIARRGIYAESAVGDISPERRRRFFTQTSDDTFQVQKRLRDSIVFAPQNLIGDAPFSKLDLISCRNLLIYLEPEIQKKVISLFHFALKDGGCLMLGPSETIGRQANRFEVISSRWRIYRRNGPVRRHAVEIPIDSGNSWRAAATTEVDATARMTPGLAELMQKQLLAEFAPASVVIDRKFEVHCFQGPTVNYLEFPSGEPTRDLLALARSGLRARLRGLVAQVIQTGEAVTGVIPRVKRQGRYFPCVVSVRPFGEPRQPSELLLVVFTDSPEPAAAPPRGPVVQPESSLVGQLENELRSTREDLQGTIEELESSIEEMKASNEEMMSMNEELQSVNEELETSKEELHSTNEEIVTVNNQLSQKIIELNAANNDISNLLNSIDIPTIFLTTDFRIRRFTPSAVRLIHLKAADLGRPIDDVTRKFTGDGLLDDCQAVLTTRATVEREVQANNSQYYLRRVLPYLTVDFHLDGVVITFIDLTDRKRAADLVNEARLFSEGIVATVREPLVVLDDSLRLLSANPSFYAAFDLRPEIALERPFFSLSAGQWDVPALKRSFDQMLAKKSEIVDFELSFASEPRGQRTMLLNARMIPGLDNEPSKFLVAIEDITERKQAEEGLKALNQTLEDRVSRRTAEAESRALELAKSADALHESEARLRAIVTTAPDAIVTINEEGLIESCNPATERMFDFPARDMIGQNIAMLLTGRVLAGGSEAPGLRPGPHDRPIHPLERESIGRRRDGSTFPVELASSELHDGNRRLITGIIRDISERKSLQQELLSIAEAEQRRIGQDLHDDIGQELTGLAMKAETLCEIVTERKVPKGELAADIVAGLDRARKKLRTLSREMVPVELDASGLMAALDDLVARLGAGNPKSLVFECPDRSIEIETLHATQLYHIAQEAITNALKHAQARTIRVSLACRESAIKLEVRDDGIGIADNLKRADGMGLRIMSYRAGLIHGTLDIERAEGGGTLVRCVMIKGTERGSNNPQGPSTTD